MVRTAHRFARFGVFTWLVAGLLSAAGAAQEPVDVLKVAHELGEEMKGWKHGTNTNNRQINAVQFTLRVVERLHPTLSKETRERILMSDLTEAQTTANKKKIITSRDKRTRGVAQALLDAGLAREVALEDARPGDFIQYWINPSRLAKEDDGREESDKPQGEADKPEANTGGDASSGVAPRPSGRVPGRPVDTWNGHAGVIERVERNARGELKAWVYSSHRWTGGVGVAPSQGVRLVDEGDRRIYIVRWNGPSPAGESKPGDAPPAK